MTTLSLSMWIITMTQQGSQATLYRVILESPFKKRLSRFPMVFERRPDRYGKAMYYTEVGVFNTLTEAVTLSDSYKGTGVKPKVVPS